MALSFDSRIDPAGGRRPRGGRRGTGGGAAAGSRASRASSSRRTSSQTRKSRRTGPGTAPEQTAGRRRAAGTGRGASHRGSSSSRPVKGKRRSLSARDKASAERASHGGRSRGGSAKGSAGDAGGEASARRGSSRGEAASGGRRVGDIRAAERERRNRARYRRYILRIAAAVAVVLAVVFGSIFVYRSDLFHVANVHVNGVSHLTSSEITDIAAVPDDSTLLRLDAQAIVDRLEQNAWVQDATVNRVFPDTLEIDITERQPGAVVRVSDKATWVISTDGTWLSAATQEDWQEGPRIVDVSKSLAQPVSGSDCNDGGIKNALAIIAGISDDLKSKIKSISAASSIKTSLNLEDGTTVAFGDSSDIQLKEAAIDALLEQYAGKISYINVRVPSRPTYRTLEG